MRLALGVENAAYSDASAPGATTTGEVAEILEAKYHIMQVFYELHKADIADKMARGMMAQLTTLKAGGPQPKSVLPGAMSKIETEFRNYLNRDEWQAVTGLKIAAAKDGKSLRFKGKQGKSARPAFVDTGLYRRSFRAEIK